MWIAGFAFMIIATSLYSLYVAPKSIAAIVTIGAIILLAADFFCCFIQTLSVTAEQRIFVITALIYLVFDSYMIHSFALVPISAIAAGAYILPIFSYKAVHLYAMVVFDILVIDMIASVFDRSFLSKIELGTFYLSETFTLVCLVFFVLVAKYQERYKKRLEEETEKAIEANKSKSTFLANMSHEIRTPMNAILGMSELLLLDDMNDTQKEYLNTIHNSSKSLLNIINDILDFSKIDAGKLELIEDRYDLASMTQDVSNIIETRLKDKKVIFTNTIDPNLPSVLMGDEVRIKQVLINVLGNSCKHTNKGYVSLEIKCSEIVDDMVEITFIMKDTGSGIPKNDLEHIFDAFNQADTKKNRNIEGTGLGLAITKKLAEAMGGSVVIESDYGLGTSVTVKVMQKVLNKTPFVKITDPEKYKIYLLESNPHFLDAFIQTFGSLKISTVVLDAPDSLSQVDDVENSYVFYNFASFYEGIKEKKSEFKRAKFIGMVKLFDVVHEDIQRRETLMHSFSITKLLAILENRASDQKTEEKKTVKPFRAPGINVLVVDDKPVNLKVAASMMKIFELNVSFAGSGMDCLKLLEQGNKYDIIFMDHMMPQMDGIETTHRIREREKGTYEHNVIIALTANAIKGVEKMFLDEGLDDYIFKPMDLASLDAILRKWIDPDKQFEEE
ncbi:MAG: response regulator [Lachnospiraceae bacterium]|nr:response regulator [Lachnospiraceae bacterium]